MNLSKNLAMDKKEDIPLILICDDTPKNIQVLGTILMEKGYHVTVAEDGTDCLKMLETVKPDLILLDIMMPTMNGYEACEKIKEDPDKKDIPIIFLSAKNEIDDIVKGLSLGAVDFVSKPFNSIELLQRVRTQLEIKRSKDVILKQKAILSTLIDNLEEGFFIFDKNGKIQEGYSKSVESFIGKNPNGEKVEDFIPLSTSDRDLFKKWYKKVWNSKLLIKDLMPLAPKGFSKGKNFYGLNFTPIFQEIKETRKKKLIQMICTIKDKTEQKKLEEIAENEKSYVSMMLSVLQDPFSFLDFIEDQSELIQNCLEELKENNKEWKVKKPDEKKLLEYFNHLFRQIHTLKAEALRYSLSEIKKLCIEVENIIFKIREETQNFKEEEVLKIIEFLQKISGSFSKSFFSIQTFLDLINNSDDKKSSKRIEIQEVYQYFKSKIREEKSVISDFERDYFHRDIHYFFEGHDQMLKNMAFDLNKEIEIKVYPTDRTFNMKTYSHFFSTLIHILRNALDHGIEEKVYRKEVGKKEAGLIEIRCKDGDEKKEGEKEKEKGSGNFVLDQFARVIMSVKSFNATFNTNDGIMLPGYSQRTSLMGFDDQWLSPGLDFIAGGYQERDLIGNKNSLIFANHAYQNNWLVDTNNFQYINTQYVVNHTENMNFKVSVKPINSLRIDLSADRNFMENRTANLGVENDAFSLLNNQFNGSFSTSIITWKTAFKADKLNDTTLTNQIWENLQGYRKEISYLLSQANPNSLNTIDSLGYYNGYGNSQQDVIIGAFLCAYNGETPTLQNINPFSQKIPLPNWRISFDGLGKIKPLRKHVKKLAFSHGYRSNFSLSSYTTNLNGSWDEEGNPIETDIAGNFISERQIMTLNILVTLTIMHQELHQA